MDIVNGDLSFDFCFAYIHIDLEIVRALPTWTNSAFLGLSFCTVATGLYGAYKVILSLSALCTEIHMCMSINNINMDHNRDPPS